MVGRFHFVAALLALSASPSWAQGSSTSACVSRAEANALFVNTLPDIIEGVRDKCAASLPANAFLTSQGPSLVARYRVGSSDNWALARAGFTKMAGSKGGAEAKIMAALPDEALKTLLGTAFSAVVASDLKVKDCAQIDRFVSALSPLPAANVAEIVTGLIVLAGADKGDQFQICKDEPAAVGQ